MLDQLALLQGESIAAGQTPAGPTVEDAFARATAAKVQIAVAKRRGFTVTAAEIAERVADEREAASTATGEARTVFEAELSGRGLTADEFWAQEAYRYETMLLVAKLRDQFIAEHGLTAGERRYKEYVEALQSEAEVRILEPDYLLEDSVGH